jgi:hypothetical protein
VEDAEPGERGGGHQGRAGERGRDPVPAAERRRGKPGGGQDLGCLHQVACPAGLVRLGGWAQALEQQALGDQFGAGAATARVAGPACSDRTRARPSPPAAVG